MKIQTSSAPPVLLFSRTLNTSSVFPHTNTYEHVNNILPVINPTRATYHISQRICCSSLFIFCCARENVLLLGACSGSEYQRKNDISYFNKIYRPHTYHTLLLIYKLCGVQGGVDGIKRKRSIL